MRQIKRIVEEEQQEDHTKRASLLERELSFEAFGHAAQNFSAVVAQEKQGDRGEDNTVDELVFCEFWVHIRNMEVNRCAFELVEGVRRSHINGHIVHFILNLGKETHGEVQA